MIGRERVTCQGTRRWTQGVTKSLLSTHPASKHWTLLLKILIKPDVCRFNVCQSSVIIRIDPYGQITQKTIWMNENIRQEKTCLTVWCTGKFPCGTLKQNPKPTLWCMNLNSTLTPWKFTLIPMSWRIRIIYAPDDVMAKYCQNLS